jgi:hypothetical protein
MGPVLADYETQYRIDYCALQHKYCDAQMALRTQGNIRRPDRRARAAQA